MNLFILFSGIFLFSSCTLFSQEFLNDSLLCNDQVCTYYLQQTLTEGENPNKDTVVYPSPYLFSLKLPFKDDFSQTYIYPDGKKWIDRYTYVNATYPLDPPTYGVATFDGLNEKGLPYNPYNSNAYGIADYLTSFPIDLSSAVDSVYLSFYYQPQGLGNKPEEKDSLVLQFYHPKDSIWKSVWHAAGTALTGFKRVMIYVDTTYYKDRFQFRFYNYATLSGNLDHWHIDYVYLDDQRTFDDTLMYDVAFLKPITSFLQGYNYIPWKHYKSTPTAFMKPNITLRFKNYSTFSQNIFYKVRIDDKQSSQVGIYPSVPGVFTIINPQQTLDITLPVGNTPFSFTYPSNSDCSTFFVNRAYFSLGSGKDSLTNNDSTKFYQHFGNYYAWDDGTAEAAYGVYGIASKVAVEYTPVVMDTLSGVDIYFNPVVNNATMLSFKVKIWNSLSPENILYEEPVVLYPQYTSPVNTLFRYYFSSPLVVNSTFYIGWENITSDVLNVGFDYNTDHSDRIYYNVGNGWQNTSFAGSLMLRPVFGTCNDKFVSANAYVKETDCLRLFPNPATTFLELESVHPIEEMVLMDISGKQIQSQVLSSLQYFYVFPLETLEPGTYLFRVRTSDSTHIRKIVISR